MELIPMLLVINAGSSSFKCAVFKPNHQKPIWKGSLHWRESFAQATFKIETENEKIQQPSLSFSSLEEGLFILLDDLQKRKWQDQLQAVGHRVVHGGRLFTSPTLLTSPVIKKIEELIPLAPLHNPANLKGIIACQKKFPAIPHIGIFDTAFHSTLPDVASYYPLPVSFHKEGIRRYGFHGINHQYCSQLAPSLLRKTHKNVKLISCHLGSGASLCAVKNGQSIETTMGFTPLEGLMMGTRSGSIDPSILLYLHRTKHLSMDHIEALLNFQSGLFGVSGQTSDFQALTAAAQQGNAQATLAITLFSYHLRNYLGAMIAVLEGADALIFTGGIGENAHELRSEVCSSFHFMGVKIDEKMNKTPSDQPRNISTTDSKVDVLVIPAQEEWEIACQCRDFLKND